MYVGDGVGALEPQLAHVGHVEKACLFADGHVLGDDAGGILDRHQKAAEFDDLAAHVHVCLIQRGFLFHECILHE